MGQFKITVTAVGGHGCSRETKSGEKVTPCGNAGCPDCIARAFVEQLKATPCYASVPNATLEHWPGEAGEVTDNLLTGVRTGQFGR